MHSTAFYFFVSGGTINNVNDDLEAEKQKCGISVYMVY